MKKTPTSEIKDDMVLARPVTSNDGKILLNIGTILKSSLCSRLHNWNIAFVFVADEGEDLSASSPAERDEKIVQLSKTFQDMLDIPRMLKIHDAVKVHFQEKYK